MIWLPPHHLLSVSSTGDTQEDWKRKTTCWQETGSEKGEGAKSYDGKTDWSSIIHLILSGKELSRCNYCKFCSSYRFEKSIRWGNLFSFYNTGIKVEGLSQHLFTTSVLWIRSFWYGSGSGSCSFRKWPSRCRKKYFFLICAYYFLKYIYIILQR
jgi:hypothetical protein